jgi:group I intron endonuclease
MDCTLSGRDYAENTYGHWLYRLTSPSGRRYYGITKDWRERFAEHAASAKSGSTLLAKAIRKYGWGAFTVEVLGNGSREIVKQLERSAIAVDNTMAPHGYNLTAGGDGTVGYRHTPEECQRRSVWAKENCADHMRTLGRTQKDRPPSLETRQKMRNAALRRPREVVLAHTNALHSLESKQKHKDWFNTPEGMLERARMSERARATLALQENPTKGRLWVNNGARNRRVIPEMATKFLADGWRLGQLRRPAKT